MRFKCEKKEKCKRCTECCRFREKAVLTKKEDLMIRKKMYEKTGVLYRELFFHYTISITKKEKERLKILAKQNNIEIDIRPKKIIIRNNKAEIIDYYLNHDVCPFLEDKRCIIYEDRPKVCRDFPHYKKENQIRGDTNKSFDEAIRLSADIV